MRRRAQFPQSRCSARQSWTDFPTDTSASYSAFPRRDVRTTREKYGYPRGLGGYPRKRHRECGILLLHLSMISRTQARFRDKPKIMILGGGPNRIGQGIEFDYCCVHAALALKKLGFESIIVNCNPETVSTDYDTSDKLYFEPLTLEDVLSYPREGEAGRRYRAVRRSDATESCRQTSRSTA